jgi:1-acyl-sn-glycerol-3-phosphate acyltransferase
VNDKGKPIMLICNHTSWWDGIWALHLNQQLFGRKFHFMMLEEQLKKNWFFRYTGGFSVQKSNRSVVESLIYSAELLENKNNMVLMFPQGKIQSMHRTAFNFEKGIERILKQTKNDVELVFEVNLVDYFSQVKPSVYLNATSYKGEYSLNEIQEAYNVFYLQCIHQQEKKEV